MNNNAYIAVAGQHSTDSSAAKNNTRSSARDCCSVAAQLRTETWQYALQQLLWCCSALLASLELLGTGHWQKTQACASGTSAQAATSLGRLVLTTTLQLAVQF